MNDGLFETDDASTPLTADEKKGLLQSHITLRSELNEAEQAGIVAAEGWAFARKRNALDEIFLRRLHKEMFKDVWIWAGEYSRENDRHPVGLDGCKIGAAVLQLVRDVEYWIDKATFTPDEIAARFHHGLVSIHPFPNGNGRHARLATDILLKSLDRPPFTWGRKRLEKTGDGIRQTYVAALRAADNHDFGPLMDFTRKRTLVFQYGSNCLSSEINGKQRLCGDAKVVGIAQTVSEFALGFTVLSKRRGCAAADIVETKGSHVWGVLYEVPDYLLDRETAAARGRKSFDEIENRGVNYERAQIKVRKPDGAEVTALTYRVIAPKAGLKTGAEYVGFIVRGLRENGVNDDYIETVKRIALKNNPDIAAEITAL